MQIYVTPTQNSEVLCPTQTCAVFRGLYNLLIILIINDKERASKFFFFKDSFKDTITSFEQNILNWSFNFELF